jgi:hypothetical protein
MTEGVLASSLSLALDRVEFACRLGLDPDPWQRRLLLSDHPRVLLNVARQSGKSTMSGVLALHRALYRPGSLILILAPAERQAKELFSKVSSMLRTFDYPIPSVSDRRLGVELANGSRIEALPGSEKTIRGFSDVDLLILDEAARIEDSLYYAVRPMLAVSGGRLLMLSTPHGKRGVFYHEWTEGIGWDRYEVPASENPRISSQFLRQESASFGPLWFAQEYECQFLDLIGTLFPSALIDGAFVETDEEDIIPLYSVGA